MVVGRAVAAGTVVSVDRRANGDTNAEGVPGMKALHGELGRGSCSAGSYRTGVGAVSGVYTGADHRRVVDSTDRLEDHGNWSPVEEGVGTVQRDTIDPAGLQHSSALKNLPCGREDCGTPVGLEECRIENAEEGCCCTARIGHRGGRKVLQKDVLPACGTPGLRTGCIRPSPAGHRRPDKRAGDRRW